MSEHSFSYGPQKGMGPAESAMLEEIAAKIGVNFVTYPWITEFDRRWDFCWMAAGFGAEDERTEDRLRSALTGEPIFQEWCQRQRWTP